MRVCRSPWLIAAYHGLHRLCVPRHPPHAIARLTTKELTSRQGNPRHFRRLSIHVSKQSTRDDPHGPSSTTTTRVSTQNSDALQHQLFACSCDFSKSTIYHSFRCQIAAPLPCDAKFRGEPSIIARNLLLFKSMQDQPRPEKGSQSIQIFALFQPTPSRPRSS